VGRKLLEHSSKGNKRHLRDNSLKQRIEASFLNQKILNFRNG
jgi:hypothetical protein